MDECCGNCKFCVPMTDEWCCDNEDSEWYGLSVGYDDGCECFEERME